MTEKLVLDATSFTGPERLECQTHFDVSFGDLLRCVYDAINPNREGPMTALVVDRDGVQYFPDQIIQYMLWVQTKRDQPDAELSDLDDLRWSDLANAYVRGRLGKDDKNTKPSKSSPESSSADSSAA